MFREPTSEDEPLEQVYLIYGNEQHGPYSLAMVSILRDNGTLPKDTLYWKQGLTGARPLPELADEIAAALPRPHHYTFAYHWLPTLVFAREFSHVIRHSTTHELLAAWKLAGERFSSSDRDSPDGLAAEVVRFAPNAELLLITMPTPRRDTEAYFVGIRSSIPDDPKSIRFFVLSHSSADEKYGPAEGCVREITADKRNFRAKDFVEPFKEDFIAAIRELCENDPGGWSCVQPP